MTSQQLGNLRTWSLSQAHFRESNSAIAFLPPIVHRTPPTSLARRSHGSRRPSRPRARTSKPQNATVRLDPILDDGDIDTTDITTYVSCPTCCNSIMLRPEQLAKGPVRVVCNCCDRPTQAGMNRLETIDGTPFDGQAWRASRNKAVEEPGDHTDVQDLLPDSGLLSP